MANINPSDLTREQIEKAMACRSAEELMAVAKAEGMEITKEEAEAYMDEFSSADLDDAALGQVAGGCCSVCGELWATKWLNDVG